MGDIHNDPRSQAETTCGSLLYELQIIWDEVGESETARDKMLLELEQECLEVYRRKVDVANCSRAQLRQSIADSEAELAAICSAIGELPVHIRQTEQKSGSLKEELNAILSQLEEMRKRKADRKNQFLELIEQIQNVSIAIHGSAGYDSSTESVDDNDLTLRRLEELQKQLQSLQMEKSDRLKQVLENLSALSLLCSVLGLDYKETVKELHPSLVESEGNYSISSHTLQQLESSVKSLRELKLQRRQRLQDLATMLLELWNLMDTPVEEQQPFQHVTCNIAASEDEITGPNMLSADFIQYVGAEVSRLEELKSSKMKELVLKKRAELDEICRKTHMIPALDDETEHLIEAIESGALDPASVLEQMELEVSKVKEEAFSRKDILEKVEKWLSACEEEEWLEQYNMDENRYNAGRGSHLILKRAEKARTIVNKLPGMVEALAAKTQHWEEERGLEFLYDGVHLLSMLEEYITLRQDKEQEKKRQREQKKLQGQLMAEQEVLFGSKPSPMKSAKKSSRVSAGGGNGRRVSVGGNAIQTPRPDSSHSARGTPNLRPSKRDDNMGSQTVQRVLDKNFTFNGRETEPAVVRRPFSPISSTASTRAHEDFYDDDNNAMQQQTAFQKETSQQIFTTPSKNIPAEDEENWTPKMHIPEPATPSTASAPMHTSMTPAPLHQPDFHDGDKLVEETDEEVEYSFEERRAGFVLPNTHLKRVIQV
ncbi:65-kDa microtubule-associated protein 3-like [Chenopodium quinoa]|uniref:LOW QUALITY PROTEIN: 65-kDa microtubule-associated protein 3-like n=1 Tax=Chenopodium quinoa TaxID=63459 RepID=UPI000B78B599|nr:LOW QUALITY PROTEIN: 65-kDa microtubule-associated protein 3-like [Chenopodium quinoa]XP_021725295.1 65-kDa microtubule-associated protein 3-like [Chenopodium quinoa]